ncbi:MAG: DUF1461 domain-containing protein [Nanoarchaeota archaeon]|nr:DUF1461 domain-containing protein [Nanoarchaeota archaeon]
MHKHETLAYAFFLGVFLITSSIFEVAYSMPIYDKEFEKTGVYGLFDRTVAQDGIKEMLSYLRYGEPLSGKFTDAEADHLKDVRGLLITIRIFYLFSLVSCIIMIFRKADLSQILRYAGLGTGAAMLLLMIICAAAGFDTAFQIFHDVFFRSNYAFDPAVSFMKAMLPDRLFLDLGIKIMLSVAIKCGALILLSHLLVKIDFTCFKIRGRKQASGKKII